MEVERQQQIDDENPADNIAKSNLQEPQVAIFGKIESLLHDLFFEVVIA